MTPKNNSYLFIFAHPDDESFYSGGLISEVVSAGYKACVLSLTSPDNPDRITEFRSATSTLGAKGIIGPFRDGTLQNNAAATRSYIAKIIKNYQPSHIVTFGNEPYYNHYDHIAAEAATIAAWQGLEKPGHLWRRAYQEKHTHAHQALRQSRPTTKENRDTAQKRLSTMQTPNLTVPTNKQARQKQKEALSKHFTQNPSSLILFIEQMPLEEYYYVQK